MNTKINKDSNKTKHGNVNKRKKTNKRRRTRLPRKKVYADKANCGKT